MNKKDLKHVHRLSIGGVEHPLQLRMIYINDFFDKYNRVLVENEITENDSAQSAAIKARVTTVKVSDLISEVVFKSMFKTGFLFWKKPFRSPGQMMKKLLKEEYKDFSSFVADHIMNDPKKDDKKSGSGVTFTQYYGVMEQRFNHIVYRLKLLNYSIKELLDLNILKAHEQILYNDHERMLIERDTLMVHGVTLKDDKYFKDFFNKYEEHFRVKSEADVVVEKISAKPLLKG